MNKKMILGSLIASTILQAAMPALAQMDLPLPPPPAPAPVRNANEGIVQIRDISHKSGGTWYRVSVRRPVSLLNLEVGALSSRLKIHQGSVVLENGQRINVREYQNTAVFGMGERAISENLNGLGRIVAIDLLLESYGGSTDIMVKAISAQDRVLLSVEETSGSSTCQRAENITAALSSVDAEMVKWSQRKSSYYSSSEEYKFADTQVRAAAQRLVSIAQSEQAARNPIERLQQLANEYSSKMGNYYSSSTEFAAYRDVARALFNSLSSSLDQSLNCDGLSTKAILALAESFATNQSSYDSSSAAYAGFGTAAKKAFDASVVIYEKEARNTRKDFTAIDKDIVEFASKQTNYYSSSPAYSAYARLVTKASELSEADFRIAARRMSADVRFSYMSSFNDRKSSYYSSSPVYTHFERMKNIALNGN